MKQRFSEEQIIGFLKEAEAGVAVTAFRLNSRPAGNTLPFPPLRQGRPGAAPRC